jgi:hypothetical protein
MNFNSSKTDQCLLPKSLNRTNPEPGCRQRIFNPSIDKLCLVGSRDGREEDVMIHQNIDFYSTSLQFRVVPIESYGGYRSHGWVAGCQCFHSLNGRALVAKVGGDRQGIITLEATVIPGYFCCYG